MPTPNPVLIPDVVDVDIDDADLAACEQALYSVPPCLTLYPC